jgi:integrase
MNTTATVDSADQKTTASKYASHRFIRVAPYLYRAETGMYYGKLKRNGKIHQKSLETSDFQTAKRSLKDFEKEVESKKDGLPDMRFEDFTKQWLESIKPHLKESTHRRRQVSVNQLLSFFKGNKLAEITQLHLEKWIKARASASAQTFNLDRETLHAIFAYAKKHKIYHRENPISDVKKRKAIKAVVVSPTREQFAALLKVMRENKHDHHGKKAVHLVEFLAYSGTRIAEALSVQWRHVDFERGTILITGGDKGTKNYSQRSIPLFPPLRELLERISGGKTMPPMDYIFIHKSSKTALKHASKRIGLPEGEHFTHHGMRHFFCSNAIEKNIDFKVIAAWLGHKDGGILVAKTYGHLRQTHSHEMAKLMTFSA